MTGWLQGGRGHEAGEQDRTRTILLLVSISYEYRSEGLESRLERVGHGLFRVIIRPAFSQGSKKNVRRVGTVP